MNYKVSRKNFEKENEYERKPYLDYGIIGNSSMLVTLGKSGKINRLFWPNIDMYQQLDNMKIGVFIEGKTDKTQWSDDETIYKYKQFYLDYTNILCTECYNKVNHILIKTTDFVVPYEDLLIRRISVINKGLAALSLKLIFYLSMNIEDNKLYNAVTYSQEEDSLIYYKNSYFFMLSSTENSEGFQSGNVYKNAEKGSLSGKISSLGSEGALSFEVSLKKGEEKQICFSILCARSYEILIEKHKELNKFSVEKLEEETVIYWKNYLSSIKNIKDIKIEEEKLYKRSILAIKLLADYKSGSISAAPEVDETFSKSGGYNYCWIRDGAYICNALVEVNIIDICEKFFRWAAKIQEKNGAWLQRYFHNGNLAPSWGFQVDEGATLIFSIWKYYLKTKNIRLIKELWKTIEMGCEFLLSYIDCNYLSKPSYDLWEERVGQHSYSTAAIAAALKATYALSQELASSKNYDYLLQIYNKIKNSIYNNLWNASKNCYLRSVNVLIDKDKYNQYKSKDIKIKKIKDEKGYIRYIADKDDIVDSSLLGLSYPFEIFSSMDKRMQSTADAIERILWNTKVGGLKRYENDEYIGGNPWIVTTLWLAIFRQRQGYVGKAKTLFNWVLEHRTSLNLLSEQIDKETGEPAWVIPLAWSHAMYLLYIKEKYKVKL